MNVLHKIIIVIYTLIFTALSISMILFSIGTFDFKLISTSFSALLYKRWEIGIVGIILLIINVILILYGLRRKELPEATVSNGELGNISITLGAIESLVQKVVREVKQVKESNIKIKKYDTGISIILKITVDFDVVIPDLCFELQKTIKEYIENTSGIVVKDVRISIVNVANYTSQKAAK